MLTFPALFNKRRRSAATVDLKAITSVDAASGETGLILRWHPTTNHVLVGSTNTGKEIAIYSFNGTTLSEAATVNLGALCIGVSWNPDGDFFAATNYSGNDLKVYSWNGSDTVAQVATIDLSLSTRYCDWSPDGDYLAVGTQTGAGAELRVYSWNGTDTLTSAETVDLGAEVAYLAWSHDGDYLATIQNTKLVVYSWNGTDTLAEIDDYTLGGGTGRGIIWSNDDKYLFFSGSYASKNIVVISFDGTTLAEESYIAIGSVDVYRAGLDSTGKFLFYSNYALAGITTIIRAYSWNSGTETLTEVDTLTLSSDGAYDVDINYNNDYIAYPGVVAESKVLRVASTGL